MDDLRKKLASRPLYSIGDMTPEAKKHTETEIVTSFFQRLCPEIILDIKKLEPPHPDFAVHVKNDNSNFSIGLELTEFYALPLSGSPFRNFLSQWRQFAYNLRNSLIKKGYESVHGSVFFKEFAECHPNEEPKTVYDVDIVGYRQGPELLIPVSELSEEAPKPIWYNPFNYIQNKQRGQLSNEICNLLEANKFKADQFHGGANLTIVDNHDRYPILSKYLDHLFVRQFLNEDQSKDGFLWWCSHLASGPIFNPSTGIRKAVENKLEKKYQSEGFDEVWLLVYAPGWGLDDVAFIDRVIDLNLSEKKVSFNRIYIWDKFSETITLLYPEFEPVFCNADHLHRRGLPSWINKHLVVNSTGGSNCLRQTLQRPKPLES